MPLLFEGSNASEARHGRKISRRVLPPCYALQRAHEEMHGRFGCLTSGLHRTQGAGPILGITRITVRRAMQILHQRNVIHRRLADFATFADLDDVD